MKKLPSVGLFILLIVCFLQPVAAQQPVFRIGILDDEAGSISKGAGLAVQEINARGGVRGADGTLFRLELIVQPTEAGARLQTAVSNLNQANIVAALGPATSNEVLSNLQLLQSLNVPVLTPATNDSILVSDATDLIFRSRAAQILHGQALATYLIEEQGLRSIAAVQLDVNSTDSVVGFSSAAQTLGVSPQILLLQSQVANLAPTVIQSNPQVVVAYGSPQLAAELLAALRQGGWSGTFAYDQAATPEFTDNIARNLLANILSTTAWPFTAADDTSVDFLVSYVHTFGTIPDSLAAASYDSVNLLALAIGQPGELRANLRSIDNLDSVQGVLRPAQLSAGEVSNNVAIVSNNALGVPQVIARYAGGSRLPDDQPIAPAPPTTVPTATPEGVVVTVTDRAFQNVRSGPSTQFEVLGRLNEGEQARVIGANQELTWVVIDFRGRQGWMSVPLLEVFGDLRTVPIIQPPPTPTPAATSTPIPPQEADIIIESASVTPSPIIAGQLFNLNVVVRNIGNSNAGSFAIAATLPPNDVFVSTNINGLGAGQAITATMSGTMTNTGFYTVVIVADLNNQVPEGPGENNNTSFNFSYSIDKPIINQGSTTLVSGATIDLEGNVVQGDANWTGSDLNALGGARLGIINNANFANVHWDLINSSIVNQATIPGGSLTNGTVIGVHTADGNRGVMRVDGRSGSDLSLTYRVYQN